VSRNAGSDTLGRDAGPSTLQGALDSIARAGRRPIPIPFWADLKRLPREARDTLFLLAVIGWTVLPHVEHLPGWSIALTALVLAWRARLAFVNGALPNRWVLGAVLALAIGLTFWSYRTLLGKEPGVTLAVALMALKTLELRARRDAFVVFFLGFFIILTHFLYSQSLPVAIAMLVSVWGLLTAVVLAHMPVGQPSLKQAGGLAARTALLGAPVMALMFLLFPRIGPLWGVPQDGISKTGLSNVMKMGSMTEVALDDSIAMRLRFDGRVPAPAEMYFRGPVLTQFDGVEWRPLGLPYAPVTLPSRPPALKTSGAPLSYEATFEPLRVGSVPLLEATTEIGPVDGYRIVAREDLQWLAERPVLERLRFRAVANTRFVLGAPAHIGELQGALDLPDGFNPRTIAWAHAFRDTPALRGAKAQQLANALLQHIRTEGFTYTLAPGGYGRNGVDEFWLDRKEGFCEHFASAFVVVMRAIGVPARIVTGYQGTDLPPTDNYYIVRQSSAHAWAEYWQSGVGWIRADPTGAVAPDRITRSSRLAPQPGFVAGTLDAMSPQLFARLRGSWEAINNRWNQWVLNYSRGQQLDVLKQIGFSSPTWEDLALLLVAALSGLALAGAVWAWLDRHRVDPWVRQLERIKRALRALGVVAAAHEPPRTLAARVRERLGSAGEPLAALLDALEAQRYSRAATKRPDRALTRDFTTQARRLRASAAR
jgi:protein-glutamine gamma-glutamyltransferase